MTSPAADPEETRKRARKRARNAAIFGSIVAAVGIAALLSAEPVVFAVLPAIALLSGVIGVWIWNRGTDR